MPVDLITAAELLLAWPQASALDPAEQAALVAAASRRVESECDRIFGAGTYYEVHRPGRTRKLYLRQKPVTAITRVAADFAAVLTVQNTDPAVYEATVGFSGPSTPEDSLSFTGLTLNAIASGVPAAAVTLLFSDYPTLAALAAQANTLSGWSASAASGFTAFPSAYLAGDAGRMGCTQLAAELKAYTRALPFACDPEMARKGVVELFEGQADGYRYPDRRFGAYGYSPAAGGGDPRVGGVAVSYAAGYAQAAVPADLKRATAAVAKFLRDQSVASGVYSSETFKDYSYDRLAVVELPKDVRAACYNHSRKEIA